MVSGQALVTSGEIKNTALESIRGRLHKSNLDKITRLFDVHKLISLINEHMPDFWFHDRILLSAAHSMRSNIGAAMSRALYLAEHPNKPAETEVRKIAREISDEIKYLERTVEMVTNFRRQDISLFPSYQNPHELLLNAVSTYQRFFSDKGLQIRIDNVEDLASIDSISIDEYPFKHIVYNLLKNSLDYSGNDSAEVDISFTLTNKQIALHFQDNGIGVPNGYEEQIFIAGYRAPNAVKYKGSGIGLGLTVSRNLIKLLGGEISLTNRSCPTEFTVYLTREGAK